MERTDFGWIPNDFIHTLFKNAAALGVELEPGLTDGRHLNHLPQDRFLALYQRSISALTANVCAMDGRVPITWDDCELLCHCIIHSETLAEALHRSIRFARAMNGRGASLSLLDNGRRTIFFMDTRRPDSTLSGLICDVMGLCFYYKLFSWLIAEPLAGLEVTIAHKPLLETGLLRDLFGCPVYFTSMKNAFSFHSEMLQRPVLRSARHLVALSGTGPLELTPPPRSSQLSRRLIDIIEKTLREKSAVPSAEEAASLLGQSGPSLRRNLAREGVSFQNAVRSCRMQLATELLGERDRDIDEIAYELGFRTPGSFSRAFKDWSGCAPSVYRDNQEC